MVAKQEVVARMLQCVEAEPSTMFVIFKSMNTNCVIYKSKTTDGMLDCGKALEGVEVEWLM